MLKLSDPGDGNLMKKFFRALDLVVETVNIRFPDKKLMRYSGRKILSFFSVIKC